MSLKTFSLESWVSMGTTGPSILIFEPKSHRIHRFEMEDHQQMKISRWLTRKRRSNCGKVFFQGPTPRDSVACIDVVPRSAGKLCASGKLLLLVSCWSPPTRKVFFRVLFGKFCARIQRCSSSAELKSSPDRRVCREFTSMFSRSCSAEGWV